jgi:hypothetical protein
LCWPFCARWCWRQGSCILYSQVWDMCLEFTSINPLPSVCVTSVLHVCLISRFEYFSSMSCLSGCSRRILPVTYQISLWCFWKCLGLSMKVTG